MQAISTAQEYGPQAIQYAQEYGPQAISAWQNYGPQAIQYAQEYGPQAISYAQNYGPQAIQYAQEYGPQAIQAWQQYGNQLPEAITFAQENAQYIPQVRGGHHIECLIQCWKWSEVTPFIPGNPIPSYHRAIHRKLGIKEKFDENNWQPFFRPCCEPHTNWTIKKQNFLFVW